jgi:hypothetical protein
MNSGKLLPRALWRGPPTRHRMVCDHSPLPRRCAVSDSNNEQKHELECLRLASDLMQLSRETLTPNLKAHCLRMAGVWTDQVAQGMTGDPARPNDLVHCRIGSCSVAAGRSAAERPLSRETVSCGGDDGRAAFAGWSRGTADAGARIGPEIPGHEPFCSYVLELPGLDGQGGSRVAPILSSDPIARERSPSRRANDLTNA